MSLKRILGTMLASRMAGRGRRGGSMGRAAMMSGLGRRRSGMGGKMGLAALGFMAYRAYQDHQSRTAGSGSTSTSTSSGSSGGIAGMVKDVVDRVSGGSGDQSGAARSSASPEDEGMQEEARAADRMSEDTALLLIRAMVTAAYSDGSLSTAERERIMGQIDEAGGTEEDRAVMEREIANPKPLDTLLTDVNDQETAEEFYLASRAAVDGETEANRAYLDDLRRRLGLSEEQVREVEEMTT